MPFSQYEDRKPWGIAFFNIHSPGLKEFSTRLSVDRYLYGKARGRMKMGGLETTDEFVSSLTRLSDRENEAFLLDALAYARQSPALLAETISAWKQGDTGRMYRLYARSGSRGRGYWHWLEQRQMSWLPKIESAIGSGQPTVVAVGALHLCGPRSLPAMLRARGYKVEQL